MLILQNNFYYTYIYMEQEFNIIEAEYERLKQVYYVYTNIDID